MQNNLKSLKRFPIILIILVFTAGAGSPVFSQSQKLKQAEDTLSALLKRLNQAGDDSTKDHINLQFRQALAQALILPGADEYTFESLKTLIKIAPEDHAFRIFHWNLPDHDGRSRCYGFIKLLKHDLPVVFPLDDRSDSIASPETAILDCHHWFGALYYRIIAMEAKSGKRCYTLLGWAGSNAAVTRKIIEVLSFDDQEQPRFGMTLFPDFAGGAMTRVVFRYSATTSMSLKYEEQVMSVEKKWNIKKRGFEEKTSTGMMIVYDRLVPLDPQLEGQFQYYVPAGELFDAFQVSGGTWHYIAGVETRNRK